MREKVMGFIRHLVVEWPASRKTLAQHAQIMEAGRQKILDRAQSVDDNDLNQRVLSHVIGIERWGQQRLKAFLGHPYEMDEYNEYRPERGRTLSDLIQDFIDTRTETVKIASLMAEATQLGADNVPHNQFGPLSPQGWLQYLNFHATQESSRMK